jgi:hypothetical protein
MDKKNFITIKNTVHIKVMERRSAASKIKILIF